jgi:hypothetical protein
MTHEETCRKIRILGSDRVSCTLRLAVVLKNGKPEFAVECKSGPRTLSRNIRYFAQRTPIPPVRKLKWTLCKQAVGPGSARPDN